MGFLFKDKKSPYWYYSVGTPPRRMVGSTGIRHNNAKEQPRSGIAFEILQKKEEQHARQKFAHLGVRQERAPVRLAVYLDDFMRWHHAHHQSAKFAAKQIAGTLSILGQWASKHRLEYLHQLDFAALDQFVTDRLNAGISANSVRRNCTDFAKAWDRAIELGHLTDNPWRKLKPKPVDPKRQSRRFTAGEQKILGHEIPQLPASMRHLATVALATGARLTSLVLLERGFVDFKERLLHFPAHINKTHAYTALLTPALAQHFRDLAADGDNPHWLPADEVRDHLARAIFKDRFSSWFRHLRHYYPGHFKGASFHCFRDTFISLGADAGIDQRIMMRMVGHNSRQVHLKYTQMDLQKAIPQLTAALQPIIPKQRKQE
jgi:site-specific recombinase XerD